MARIRTIKPDYYTSLTTADLSLLAFALFPGLLTHVDDEGRCVYDPRLIKAALAPLRDEVTPADVDVCVDEYEQAGMVVRYRVDGRCYLEVTGFDEHQRVNRPTASKCPPNEAADPSPESSPTAHTQLSEGSPPEGNREQGREQGTEVSSSDVRPELWWATADTDVEAVKATATTIARMIAANGHPLPGRGSKAADTWLQEMDRLLRLGPPGTTMADPPTVDDVLEVAQWATSDHFWRSNIQSIPKLRDKWSQLALKARDGPSRNGTPTGLEAVVAASRRAG